MPHLRAKKLEDFFKKLALQRNAATFSKVLVPFSFSHVIDYSFFPLSRSFLIFMVTSD